MRTFAGEEYEYQKAKKRYWDIGNDIVKQSFNTNVAPDNVVRLLAKAYGYQTYDQLDANMKKHLQSEVLTFLLAGHDSTAALLVYVFVYLSLYPLVADKLYEEIKSK